MQMDRILKTTVALTVLALAFDYVAMNFVLGGYLATLPFLDTSSSAFSMWGIVGYIVSALVWTLVYDRVRSNFAATAGGGMQFGFYAGLLMNFPTWLFVSNYVKDWPYHAGWVWVCWGIVYALIAGAVTGIVYNMGGSKASA
jgi:hypothetical protein